MVQYADIVESWSLVEVVDIMNGGKKIKKDNFSCFAKTTFYLFVVGGIRQIILPLILKSANKSFFKYYMSVVCLTWLGHDRRHFPHRKPKPKNWNY